MWLLIALIGCTCPEGMQRSGGTCSPAGVDDIGPAEPPTEEDFLDRFDARACSELEDCAHDEICGGDDWCEIDVDCEPPTWPSTEGCVYDETQALACLQTGWTCEYDGDRVLVTAPAVCESVYECP